MKTSELLHGFNEEELFQRVLNNEITFNKYYECYRKYYFKLPIDKIKNNLNNIKFDKLKDLFEYNRILNLNLSNEEIFKYLGYEKSFNDSVEFLCYFLTNSKIKKKNNNFIFKLNNCFIILEKSRLYIDDVIIYILIDAFNFGHNNDDDHIFDISIKYFLEYKGYVDFYDNKEFKFITDVQPFNSTNSYAYDIVDAIGTDDINSLFKEKSNILNPNKISFIQKIKNIFK